MWNNPEKRQKLSWEILGILLSSLLISVFFLKFLAMLSRSAAATYCMKQGILLTELQELTLQLWIQSISGVAAVVIFLVLFLTLLGQRLAYIREIIRGVQALRTHRMDFEIPLEGRNELRELAERINELAETERSLNQREKAMEAERETLVRSLSHDIRTPLTAILSYTEYLHQKKEIPAEELSNYLLLVERKGEQIKSLTDRLLDKRGRTLEMFENGKLLMEQLAGAWAESLEDEFRCEVDLEACPGFSGEFDLQELQRIFDNLASNIEKYAAPEEMVRLSIFREKQMLVIAQENRCRAARPDVPSYKIGLESIRKIAESYGGGAEVQRTEAMFSIQIRLAVSCYYIFAP